MINDMQKISEYDERQLRLMYDKLVYFQKNQIALSSLVNGLESLLHVLEKVENAWEEKFLRELSTLETINSMEILRDSDEEVVVLKKEKKEALINNSIANLESIIK